MLLIKRLLTAATLFVIVMAICFVGTLAVLGGIAGAKATTDAKATDYQTGYAVGHEAGVKLGQKYGPVVLLGSAAVSLVASLSLSYSRALPWCRRKE